MADLTRQGVRDLNASGYNGRRVASCPHYRAPGATPVHTTSRLVMRDDPSDHTRPCVLTVYFDTCSLCGEEICERP